MKKTFLFAIPVGIAAIVSCSPKEDLTAVKSSLDSLKVEWTKTDSLVAALDKDIQNNVLTFQETYNALAANEALLALKDQAKAEADSLILIFGNEIKETEANVAELQAVVAEWKTESDEFSALFTRVETNSIPADSADLFAGEFKNYLALAGEKSASIRKAFEENRAQGQTVADELNKRLAPSQE